MGISSEEAYDADNKGSYAVSADLGVNVGPANLDISFVQGLESEEDADMTGANDTGVAGKLTTTFGDIELSAGADVEMSGESDDPDTTENEAMDWEGGASAKIVLTPNTSLSSDFIFSSVPEVASDVQVKIDDKNGLVEALDMSITWGMFDLSGGDDAETAMATENDEADMYLSGALDYSLDAMGGMLVPGTTVTVNQLDGGDATVGLEVRAVLNGAVPATTFGLKWRPTRCSTPAMPKPSRERSPCGPRSFTRFSQLSLTMTARLLWGARRFLLPFRFFASSSQAPTLAGPL